ncbi:MAG: ATP synthase F1 subunit gamma [Deltaproteobacteria bacterium]|nr:ATP synthase F1 subunit gamma [Deltaproteobacteria bacterium]
MADLRTIRRRISSIQNVKKISDAMKMVSTAKYWKLNNELEKTKSFTSEMNFVLSQLAHRIERSKVTKFIEIVLTSDRGMCGSFNSSILKSVESPSNLYVIGKKGVDHYSRSGIRVDSNRNFWENYSQDAIFNLFDELYVLLKDRDVEGIAVNYMSFKTFMTQNPKREIIYPVYPEAGKFSDAVEIEPSAEKLFEELAPLHGRALLKKCIIESLVSENAARMNAMDNASRNASELMAELKLKYNRLRQDAITLELMEITSGTEALNE